MRAKVIKAFPGVPDGLIYPRQFDVGEIIHGDLAKVAVAQKWAAPAKEEKPKEKQDEE